MTYTEYVQNYLEQQGQGTPIYTDEIAEAVAADYGIDKKKAAAAPSHGADDTDADGTPACDERRQGLRAV